MELREVYARFQAQGAEVVVVSMDSLDGARAMQETYQLPYPVLADPEGVAARAYGVYNLLGDGVATPSVFVVNAAGQIVRQYVGKTIADRPSADAILANLPPS